MQIEEYIDREYAELVRIRELLEDIEFILEYAHVPLYKNLGRTKNPDGTITRNLVYHEAPLESLRKELNKARQLSNNRISGSEDQLE